MDVFAQNKLLLRLVIVLAIINALSIGVFLWKGNSNPPPPPPHENDGRVDVSEVLKRKLNLTEDQTSQIKKIRNDFFIKEKQLESDIRAERDSMNEAMFNKAVNDSLVISLAKRISANEFNMEMLRFEQAKQFKAICTSQQLEKFNELVKEIRDYFKPNHEPGKK